MKTNKTVLIAPLDWGLGHVTRCIPIAEHFNVLGYDVVFAVSGNGVHFLNNGYSKFKIIQIEGYNITYSGSKSASISLIKQIPKIISKIRKDKSICARLVKEIKPNIIISDNRYGFCHPNVFCVFLTHQLQIKAPSFLRIFEPLLYYTIKKLIAKFDQCWIPDIADPISLAGKLSHPRYLPQKTTYVGLLSRFQKSCEMIESEFDICCLISGPNPSRIIFKENLIRIFKELDFKTVFVCGEPEASEKRIKEGNLTIYNHLNTPDLNHIIEKSKVVICRSGYSSLMDLSLLQKKVICIATPGQTEQEYLASWLSMQGKIYALKNENNLSKEIILKIIKNNELCLTFSEESFSEYRNAIKKITP